MVFLVVPWERWETRLACSSIAKIVIDLTQNKHVRIRESAFRTACALANSSDVGRETVIRHVLCSVKEVNESHAHMLAYRARIVRAVIQRDVDIETVTEFCASCLRLKSEFLRFQVRNLLVTLMHVYPEETFRDHLRSEICMRWMSKYRKSLPREVLVCVYGEDEEEEDEVENHVVLVSPRRRSRSSSGGGLVSKFRMRMMRK